MHQSADKNLILYLLGRRIDVDRGNLVSYNNDYNLLNLNELLMELKKYFEKNNINVDLEEITKISKEQILSSIPQICSFKVVEKQAILEASSIEDRVSVLISLLKMYTLEGNESENETIN